MFIFPSLWVGYLKLKTKQKVAGALRSGAVSVLGSQGLCTKYDVSWYKTNRTAFGLDEGSIGKLDRCNARKICGKSPVNDYAVCTAS
jgi:hypothetical protein